MLEARHLLIEGKVQGVGYRYFAYQAASRLGLAGWVRNLADGRVEALAEGEGETLDAWVAELRRGPADSAVTHIGQESVALRGFRSFEIAG
jgi:acylphosphatase